MNDLYREVDNLRHKINDSLDDRSSSLAQNLVKEVQRLEDDIQTGKNSQSLRVQAKKIIDILHHMKSTSVMSGQDSDRFYKIFEEIEQKLRRM